MQFYVVRIILLSAVVGLAFGDADMAAAARQGDRIPGRQTFSLDGPVASPLVSRMQQALRDAGYYKGPVTGSINRETEAAIQDFQRRENMAVDGVITEQLVSRLESGLKVRSLLQQLRRQRLLKMATARKALMQSPETRRLLAKNHEPEQAADAARDAAPCFAAPTPRCLLEEASQSAQAIFKDELRYWALSEILVAEAKAGLVEKAMDTISHIDDPRLMIVALRDIALAQARSGRPVEALTAAEIIPEARNRAEALAAIAAIQAATPGSAGGRNGAAVTLELLFKTLPEIDDPLKRIAMQTRGAVTLYKTGDTAAAKKILAEARKTATGMADRKIRSIALRHVAGALADIARPAQALEILKSLPERSEHTPVLVSAAAAQAQAGRADLALATANSITTVRYRAVVLGRIALAQAAAGDMKAANRTLDKAFAAATLIELPFAQAYANEQMAQTLKSIARLQSGETGRATFRRAVASADRISDNMLRARTLWAIAADQRLSGDTGAAGKTEKLAETATSSIRSALTRVWMFCNIATDSQAAGRPELARRAFDRALELSKTIDNPWGRARALARLAATQVDLLNRQ